MSGSTNHEVSVCVAISFTLKRRKQVWKGKAASAYHILLNRGAALSNQWRTLTPSLHVLHAEEHPLILAFPHLSQPPPPQWWWRQKSWLVGLEGETVLTSPTFSLGRAALASNALRFSEPWGNIEVKALSSWRRPAAVQSCPWLMGSVSQILGHSSSSLAARYSSSDINHTDDSSLFHRFHFWGSPCWLRI